MTPPRNAELTALREGRLDDSQETELLEKIIREERTRQGIRAHGGEGGCCGMTGCAVWYGRLLHPSEN